MSMYALIAGLILLAVFLTLKLRVKILIAFFILTQCFDLAPQIIYGKLVWDFGAILLLISAIQLMFIKKENVHAGNLPITLLGVFVGWLVLCLMYSILVYGYPVLDTLKTSRHMIIGYLSFFVFLRLFLVDKDAFDYFIKSLYIVTFFLLIVTIVQFAINQPLLFGLVTEYAGVSRYLPIFLPISLFYIWVILSKYLTAQKVKKHELMYTALVVFTTAVTFTRGIYIAVLFAFLLMLFILFKAKKLASKPTMTSIFVLFLTIPVMAFTGSLDRVIGRATSGLEILLTENKKNNKTDVDTFSGRLKLLQERAVLVSNRNPIFGYGFIHEENVPNKLRNRLKHGSVINTPEMVKKYQSGHYFVLALYSADIGWANLLIITGFFGFLIFIMFIITFLTSYRKNKIDDVRMYHFRLAFYLQTIVLLLLMFNGNTFTNHVQIPSLILAGYIYCNNSRRKSKLVDKSSSITTGMNDDTKNYNNNPIV